MATMEVLSCAIPPKSCVSVAQVKPSSIATTTLVSFIAAVPPSLALNYNDFVTRSENASSGSFDFTSSAPAAVTLAVAAAAAAVVPLIAFRSKQSFGSASPSAAFTALSEEESTVLLDIRAPQDVKATGSPNLKSLRKKPLQVAYRPDDESFVSKVVSKCREPESTTLYILDDGLEGNNKNAMAVAKLLAKSGFAKAFAITGGAEAWQESELPWLEPWKGLNLNLDGLKSFLSGTSENPNLVPTTLGAAAAAGIGVAVFTEAETVLQLLGSAAFIQIFARKFMFADDREKTIKEIQTFLDTKVAPKEFADELKEVGRVLLPIEGESEKKSKALETMTPAVADQQVN